jgi:hypothetical protein
MILINLYHSGRLGGITVSVLAIGPKVCRFRPGRGDGFLRVIKIRTTPSFRGGSKAVSQDSKPGPPDMKQQC